MYNEDRENVKQWEFSDFFNSVDFITEGSNFVELVIGMCTQPQGNMDRFFTPAVRFFYF